MTTIAMNLTNQAITQYTDYDYNSMGFLNNIPVGLSDTGIHKLEQKSHDGKQINAHFMTGYNDFNTFNQKRIRSVLVGGEADSDVNMTIYCNEDEQVPVSLNFSKENLKLSGAKAFSQRSQKGLYYQFKIANTKGAQFSIDSLNIFAIFLHTKPKGV